jgi:hypothetical protein
VISKNTLIFKEFYQTCTRGKQNETAKPSFHTRCQNTDHGLALVFQYIDEISISKEIQTLPSNCYLPIYIHICMSKINKSLQVYFFHDLKYLNHTPFPVAVCAIAKLHFMTLSYKLLTRALLL